MTNVAPGVVLVDGNDDHLRWFHSPTEHLAQILVVNFVFGPVCLHLYNKFSRSESRKADAELAPLAPPRPLNLVERTCFLVLSVAWALNVFHKTLYGPRRLTGLLYPCHPISALVLYCIYTRSKNYRRASYVWSFTVQCCILSGIAMALPDTSDIAEPYRYEQAHLLCLINGGCIRF